MVNMNSEVDYRSYVGPPQDYDLFSAMVFNLLTCIGLRQHHRVLDIGCGSLRIGRLLIPYLDKGNYFGVDPNKWLIEEGISKEIGEDLVKIKNPIFSFSSSMEDFKEPLHFDYAFAQSIFTHCDKELIQQWLKQASHHLKDDGVLFATFIIGEKDFEGCGWTSGLARYRPETMSELAGNAGLNFCTIDWSHPRQTWAMFSKKDYDKSLIDGEPISWQRVVAKTRRPSEKIIMQNKKNLEGMEINSIDPQIKNQIQQALNSLPLGVFCRQIQSHLIMALNEIKKTEHILNCI
jgi:SAM-dependent methyltransferase